MPRTAENPPTTTEPASDGRQAAPHRAGKRRAESKAATAEGCLAAANRPPGDRGQELPADRHQIWAAQVDRPSLAARPARGMPDETRRLRRNDRRHRRRLQEGICRKKSPCRTSGSKWDTLPPHVWTVIGTPTSVNPRFLRGFSLASTSCGGSEPIHPWCNTATKIEGGPRLSHCHRGDPCPRRPAHVNAWPWWANTARPPTSALRRGRIATRGLGP